MTQRLLTFFVIALLCMSFKSPGSGGTDKVQTSDKAAINWMTFEEAMERNKKNPKKVFVDLYTDWCTWCLRMEKVTFENPAIAEYINENFYPVKLDAETKRAISFKENNYVFRADASEKGIHEIAVYLTRGRLNYPSVIFLDENMGNPQPIPGFQNPVFMDKLLKFFGEDYYREIDWGLFNQIYESPLEQPRTDD